MQTSLTKKNPKNKIEILTTPPYPQTLNPIIPQPQLKKTIKKPNIPFLLKTQIKHQH